MNLGAFLDPEYPIFSTTLCYLEREDAYLMLHRIKKQDDYNHDKWVVHSWPDTIAVPLASSLSISAVTRAFLPTSASTLVRTVF